MARDKIFDTIDGNVCAFEAPVNTLADLIDGRHLSAVAIITMVMVGASIQKLAACRVAVFDARMEKMPFAGDNDQSHGARRHDSSVLSIMDHLFIGLLDFIPHAIST